MDSAPVFRLVKRRFWWNSLGDGTGPLVETLWGIFNMGFLVQQGLKLGWRWLTWPNFWGSFSFVLFCWLANRTNDGDWKWQYISTHNAFWMSIINIGKLRINHVESKIKPSPKSQKCKFYFTAHLDLLWHSAIKNHILSLPKRDSCTPDTTRFIPSELHQKNRPSNSLEFFICRRKSSSSSASASAKLKRSVA